MLTGTFDAESNKQLLDVIIVEDESSTPDNARSFSLLIGDDLLLQVGAPFCDNKCIFQRLVENPTVGQTLRHIVNRRLDHPSGRARWISSSLLHITTTLGQLVIVSPENIP